ncbi:acetyl-CoA synthetase-like protein [Rhypophila decipiens]|uniref:Acetyl-CoA synthetase-like protein n=1 Tax=Rhypophila decipiens TaxID=261697 RepID=A0AAN6YID2_9PEZI|nr:acetyl-CoA synthetase-like protein [Rhypophila decipiens]
MSQLVVAEKRIPDMAAYRESTSGNHVDHGVSATSWFQLLEWNGLAPENANSCIHDALHETAIRQPDAVALEASDGSFTYAELDEILRRLSYWLIAQGIQPGDHVPICYEKSRWAIVCMLALLYAGAAFVPVDPASPTQRLQAICKVTGARFVITSPATSHVFDGSFEEQAILEVSAESIVQLAPVDATFQEPEVRPDDVAFIMFTSGSTGQPNGVPIQHHAMVTAAMAYGAELGFGPDTVTIQFSAFVWLPCSVEIISTMIWGGKCCVPSEDERLNDTSSFIQRHQVNTAALTPSFLSVLEPSDVPSLATLIIGGEKISQELITKWASLVKMNLVYGSTETNLVIVRTVQPDESGSNITLKPVGCRVWLVEPGDPDRLVDVGEVGEMAIESWTLARGYLDNPEKEAAKFGHTPKWLTDLRPNARPRLCLTGDIAKFHGDGTVQVLGRRDDVVKLRGQKVDPNEVENAIRQNIPPHSHVSVLVSTDGQHLLAFVALNGEGPGKRDKEVYLRTDAEAARIVQAIKSDLAARLPAFLVPSQILTLYQFPLTASGKLDRRELLKMSVISHEAVSKRAPCTPHEIIMRQLWSSVLKVPESQIGLDDGFFRLGGHSLAAIRLVSEARQKNMSLSVKLVFENPTLDALSRCAVRGADMAQKLTIDPFQLVGGLLDAGTAEELLDEVCLLHPEIEKKKIEDMYPSSALQSGMMALTMRQPGAYIARCILPLAASIDVTKLEEAWRAANKQCPILRTRIVESSIGTLQVVLEQDFHWTTVHSELEAFLQKDQEQCTDMGLGSGLSRLTVVDAGIQGRHLVWTAHHAIVDAWSIKLTLGLVSSLHNSTVAEHVFPDFNLYIQHLLQIDHKAEAQYWESYLDESPPLAFPVLPSSTYTPNPTSSMIRTFQVPVNAVGSGVTSATRIRAAWALVLARYSNQNDLVFGTTLSGRTMDVPQIEHIVGPTIATVPIRVRMDEEMTISSFLDRVQKEAAGMTEFEQTGLQNIRRISPQLRIACNFQTHLIIQSGEELQLEPANMLGSEARVDDWGASASYAINVECRLVGSTMTCDVAFDEKVTSKEQMNRLLIHFSRFIDHLCLQDDKVSINDLDIITQNEMEQIFRWNGRLPDAVESCAHEVIRDVSLTQPDHAAICSWDGSLTYKELDEFSNAISKRLISDGVISPGDIVPIFMEKSLWAVVSMLAVWKAGCGWTLLDAEHPEAWVQGILEDAQAKLVVCDAACATMIPESVERLVVNKRMVEKFPHVSEDESWRRPDPASLSFVLYTSGSTGRPKAIPHTHKAFLSGALARIPTIQRDRSSRVLQFSSYAFDTAIEDTITTFLVGGTAYIPSDHERNNNLVAYMDKMAITHADFTPSFATILSAEELPSLKVLTLSGEVVTHSHRDIWAHRVTLINSYGPSEVAIISHTGQIRPDSHPSNVGMNLGCLGWIVRSDDINRLKEIGGVGELLLEGPILSSGYINNQEKTQESFISNPDWLPADKFGKRRFYRTGDLARYEEDGSIVIVGRNDSRMRKLRGQRIEVSQVEMAVKESITCAVDVLADVVTLFDRPGSESLVVFVALGGRYTEDEEQLSCWCAAIYEHLGNSLPSYMVPVAMVPLRVFPLTVHGKMDRKSMLKLVEGPSGEVVIRYITPTLHASSESRAITSPAEMFLRDLWADTLKGISADSLRSDSNFIHLGGDSILAMKMVALGSSKGDREGVSCALTVRCILGNPVLSDMALSIGVEGTRAPEKVVGSFQLLNLETEDLASTISSLAELCGCDPNYVEDTYPSTPLQQGLMALSIKRSGTYVSQQVFELPDSVNVDQFKDAWNAVHAATPILRTRIIQDKTTTVQVVVKESIDWAEDADLADYLQRDRSLPMGLGSRLARFAIAHKYGVPHFVWTMHHAIYDGWSVSLVLDSVTKAYGGDFTPPEAQYKQFIQHLQIMENDGHAGFWNQYLDGVTETAIFPRLPSPASSVQANASLDYTILLPDQRPKEATLTALIYAAWGILVSQYVESADVVFGTTRTGRSVPLKSIDEMVGPTFTTVPFRVTVDRSRPISELLARVQTNITDMISYEHLGLHSIKAVGQDAAVACNFQTLMVVQPKPEAVDESSDGSAPGLFSRASVSGDISDFNPYAVMLQFQLSQDSIAVNSSFDSRVIDAAQMQRILYQMEHLIYELCQCELNTAKITKLNMLSPQDHNEIMAWNNGGFAPEADHSLMHKVIEEQARLYPDAPAVCVWDGKEQRNVSYKELDEYATRLSWELARFGVQAEQIVPICSEKSWLPVVALLAVLKAGGAFVLLDPTHPRDRLMGIAKQTKASLLLASEDAAHLFEGEDGLEVKVFSESWFNSLPDCSQAETTETVVSSSNLACLVFTSGSTGRPKGIQLEHSAVCTSVLRGHGPALNLTRESRVFQFASFAFDMALYDIAGTLMMGGCVCMPTDTTRLNGLADSIKALQANWAFFTPSTVKLLSPDQIPCLETLVVGGEAVKQETVDTWVTRVKLFQCSGPAETTTCVTCAMAPTTNKNRLGQGAGVLCWVASQDDPDVLAPIGTVGELIIEGATVARGYIADEHNALGLFIPQPKWARPTLPDEPPESRRFYRCGDLVQYDSEGNLNFIGRKDTQVKVRGQRIELAEVEECLKKATRSDVAAEVILSPNETRRPILVAFVGAEAAGESDASSRSVCSIIHEPTDDFHSEIARLQVKATASLPPYMVPSFFIPVSRIPLNSSGKVDRKMLKALSAQLSVHHLAKFSSSESKSIFPVETPVEKLVQMLWAQVLKIDAAAIGSNSNFLHLGGDSISAMQLVSLAAEQNAQLTVADIFQNPQLDRLAACVTFVEESSHKEPLAQPFGLLPGGTDEDGIRREIATSLELDEGLIEDAYPATALQEGLMFSSIQNSGAYIAQEVYALPDDVDIEKFKLSCETVYQAHAILRSRITETELLGCINVVLGGRIRWVDIDMDVDEYLMKDQGKPIGFGEVLSRWAIVGSETKVFVWTRHHSAYDGYSLQLALDDIDRAYRGHGGESIPSSPKTSFRDFIQYLTERDAAGSVEYWQRMMGDASPSAVWTCTGKRTDEPVISKADLQFALSPRPGSSITLSTRIRAAWALLLQKYSGSDHVVFGETLSGRNVPVPGIDHCPGPAFATVPIHIKTFSSNTETETFLQEIQHQFIQMIPHQHYGLQKIMQISPEIRAACEYESLLVIQPEQFVHENSVLRPLREGGNSNFYTNALTLTCQLTQAGLDVSLHFDQSLLGERQAGRILKQFEHILKQLAGSDAGPPRRLSDIDYVSAADLAEMCEWNSSPPSVVYDTIHDVFTATAKASPDAVAIDAWDGTYTYAQLDDMTNRLAHHLIDLGVGGGQLVPLIFPKSCFFIISILAVLKAGGGFVGIAHEDPRQRIKAILDGCQPKIVLASPDCAPLAASAGSKVLVVTEELLAYLSSESKSALSETASPSGTSCAVFTSGSTGTPKGIILDHTLVCSNARVHAPGLSISSSTRVLQFANHCWDAIFIEVIYPLMYGACICVPDNQTRFDGLVEVINRNRANWMFLTPTTASLLEPKDVPTLTTLVIGGEAASDAVLKTWQGIQGNLYNIYGPAECGVFCVFNKQHKLSKKPSEVGSRMTGRLWLCDPEDHEKLVPIGCVGELLVEGYLSQGYLGQPEMTTASFLNTTSWLERIGRFENYSSVYRTGDFLRYRDDGTLEVIGRKDFQFKVNGQRLDSAEVEKQIISHLGPACRHVVVDRISNPRQPSSKPLAAFIVMADAFFEAEGPPMNIGIDENLRIAFTRLQNSLSGALPRFMVPSLFIPMNRLPVTGTGKLDRKTLRNLCSGISDVDFDSYRLLEKDKEQPVGHLEVRLQRLWSIVLNTSVESIGRQDKFFNLGGDSIMAMKLVNLAKREGLLLTVAAVFRWPSLMEMAAQIGSSSGVEREESISSSGYTAFSLVKDYGHLSPSVIANQLSCPTSNIVDIYTATSFQSQSVAATLLKSRGMLGYFPFEGTGDLDLDRLKDSCTTLVHTHDALRTVFVQSCGEIIQVVLNKVHVKFQVFETSQGDLDDIASRVIQRDGRKPLQLGDTLVAFFLVKSKFSKQFRLIIRMCHAQYDGLSVACLWKTLQKTYQGEDITTEDGEPYSKYMVEYLRQSNDVQSRAYWTGLLRDATVTEVVSRTRPRYLIKSNNVITVTRNTATIPKLHGITTATVMKTAWAYVLAELSGKTEAVFFSTVSGRKADMVDVVGACLNIIPVRVVNLTGGQNVQALLQRVQDQHTSSMEHELVGLDEIVSRCTSWPRWGYAGGSLIQHDGDWVEDEDVNSIQLGDGIELTALEGSMHPGVGFCDLAIHSRAIGRGGGGISVTVSALAEEIGRDMVGYISERVCWFVENLAAAAEGCLDEEQNNITSTQQQQLLQQFHIPLEEKTRSSKEVHGGRGERRSCSPDSDSDVELSPPLTPDGRRHAQLYKMLEEKWSEVLGLGGEAAADLSKSFFEQGGDMVRVCCLADMLRREGYEVDMEDLLLLSDTSSGGGRFHDQLALLVSL